MTAIPDGGMFEGTEWLARQREKAALRARVERNAPMVPVLRENGARLIWHDGRRNMVALECGHSVKSAWDGDHRAWDGGHSRRRCIACLSTVLAGPYRCTAHDDCREHPSLGAACWNDRPQTRPTVADAIAARLGIGGGV